MMLISKWRGSTCIAVTGASVEEYLNGLARAKIAFWDIVRRDALHYNIWVCSRDLKSAESIATRCFCNVEILRATGWKLRFKQLIKRPILLISMLMAVFLSFFMQTYVFAIHIEGNEILHEDEILRALEELDIHIGSSAGAIDQQLTKHQMLNKLPELSWIGVNRNGFRLNVLVTERTAAKTQRPNYIAANIIAVRDSVLTEVTVLEGMRVQ